MKKYFLLILFSPVFTGVKGIAQNPCTYLEINNSNADGGRLIFKSNGYNEWRARNYYGSLGFFPGEGNATALWLASTGNIGIGTTSASEKLTVNGNIVSKKVKVTQSGWPDYVFHVSYRLRPLSEVEQYIKQYHHLPDVSSSDEIEANGLDVGDNQSALLKKIEELTLYLIAQNKRLESLEKQLQQLKKGKQ